MSSEQNPLTLKNVLTDLVIFVGFLVCFEVRLTGESLHEWLSLALTGTIIVHMVLHWKWIVAVTKRFVHRLFHQSRLNYVLDAVLYVSFTVMMLSGLLISRAILPSLGLEVPRDNLWRLLHARSADLSLLMVAVHFGMHWRWVATQFGRYLLSPLRGLIGGVMPRRARTEVD